MAAISQGALASDVAPIENLAGRIFEIGKSLKFGKVDVQCMHPNSGALVFQSGKKLGWGKISYMSDNWDRLRINEESNYCYIEPFADVSQDLDQISSTRGSGLKRTGKNAHCSYKLRMSLPAKTKIRFLPHTEDLEPTIQLAEVLDEAGQPTFKRLFINCEFQARGTKTSVDTINAITGLQLMEVEK